MSVVRPRSRCPLCGHAIAAYDNIPVLSWCLLRARCRHCRAPIALRYPLVEAWLGAAAAALFLRWGGQPLWIFCALAAAAALTATALIDWDTFLIPDELSLGLVAAGLLSSPINPLFESSAIWMSVLKSVGGAVFGFALCWLLAVFGEKAFGKEAMGGGDVKLLAGVGAWSGALGAFDCLVLASLLGSVYGVTLILRRKLRRQDPIPFGPFLSAGAIFNLFYLLPPGFPFTF